MQRYGTVMNSKHSIRYSWPYIWSKLDLSTREKSSLNTFHKTARLSWPYIAGGKGAAAPPKNSKSICFPIEDILKKLLKRGFAPPLKMFCVRPWRQSLPYFE